MAGNDNVEDWMLTKDALTIEKLQEKAIAVDVDNIFWVEVVHFGKLNSTFNIGPFSSSNKRTNLVTKVCSYSRAANDIKCGMGLGKSRRKSSSFFFTDKEHRKGHKIFDGSKVGKISYTSIKKAYADLLSKL